MYGMNWFEFIVLILASFRITHLIVFDEIASFIRKPFIDVIERENEEGFKEVIVEVKGKGLRRFIGKLISCYWCTGIWVSLGVVCLFYLYPKSFFLFIVFAIAGAAAAIESKIE